METYTQDFFNDLKDGSKKSAKEIIPLVLDLVQPQSVVDVGCSLGTWLSVFLEHGLEDILGIDGNYVDRNLIEIPSNKFLPLDLTKAFTLERKFDLVMSLEVAEHLPEESAETLIDSLTKLGSVILFSAAIPFQGGRQHLNEQWPEYWIDIFKSKNYEVIDFIRAKVWQNSQVDYWYAQNIFMFVRRDYLEQHELLKKLWKDTHNCQRSLVHPEKYLELVKKHETTIKKYEQAIKKYESGLEWYASLAKKYEAAAEPQNMSLKKLLLALPVVLAKALNRRLSMFKDKDV